MDAAIDVKNSTQPNMRVVNMSLGGETLFAGGDIEDELASSMAASGISLVVSAGNAGPSGSTVGSPGTALNILTAGASSDPVNERVLRDVQFGSGVGGFYRPDDNQQMAYFSSRGPDADGRIDPDIVANGFATFAESATNGLSLVSGTSFSAPTISGVVADLYTFAPWATPLQIRNALLSTANAAKVPTATPVDQGSGHVDAVAATLAGITPIDSVNYTTAVGPLRPAERREIYYVVKKGTKAVHVSLTGITPENAPAGQNLFFGDDITLAVHSAKTSAIGEGDYLVPFDFFGSDASFTLTDLDTGLIRVTVMGDWTNVGRVSANVHITEETAPMARKTFKGKIAEGQQQVFSVTLPAGLASVKFSTSWLNDWGSYPTNDIDMIVLPPSGPANFDGATINSPERATIANPAAGAWTIIVDGFTVFNKTDNFEVRVDY
jgi:serine protease AprX